MLHEKYNDKTKFLVLMCLSVLIVAGFSSAICIGYVRTEKDDNEI
jgi:hypothetical protein